MAGELQTAVVGLVTRILGAELGATPQWLLRPGRTECGGQWETIRSIYRELTELDLPETMPPRETPRVDAVLASSNGPARILEVDETQHFNRYRALTLRRYPPDARVAFPIVEWIEHSDKKGRLEGGGFGKPKPPLFPAEYDRHAQRAFCDTLADLLPPEHGWKPTLRIGDFEVLSWIYSADPERRMRELLATRLDGEVSDARASQAPTSALVSAGAVEDAAIRWVMELERQAGRSPRDTRLDRTAAADIESPPRIIEVKAFGRSCRGEDLWLEVRQVEEARQNPNFWLYVVENVRQGDPAHLTLKALSGDRLARLLERAKEQRYYSVPWPSRDYDAHPFGFEAES